MTTIRFSVGGSGSVTPPPVVPEGAPEASPSPTSEVPPTADKE